VRKPQQKRREETQTLERNPKPRWKEPPDLKPPTKKEREKGLPDQKPIRTFKENGNRDQSEGKRDH